jgi:hypothetical protein
LTEAPGNLVIRYKQEKEKENGGKMPVLGHCLKARNGIRNTFSLVSFSKFGTDSAPTEKKRKGPQFFSFFNRHKTVGPAPTNTKHLGLVLTSLHLMKDMTVLARR